MSIPDGPCPFCAIIAEDAPSTVIHEAETMVCILDAYPASDGHALLVPREHAERMGDNDGGIISPAITLRNENFHSWAVTGDVRFGDCRNLMTLDKEQARYMDFYIIFIMMDYE